MRPAAARPASRTYHHLEEVMGTVVTIDLFDERGVSRGAVAPYVDEARRRLHDADETFSLWKPLSPMSRIRRGELAVADGPAVIAEVLDRCAIARELSGGWFDPWALGGGVDPTGFVKGWAAQRALEPLRASGVAGGMVNAAGDIASFGGLGAAPFRVGIADPFDPRTLACIVELRGALATSGTYERGEHLVDPGTGEHAARLASASVTGPDLGLADALATALAVGGSDVLAIVDQIHGYEALAIGLDNRWEWTGGFEFAEDSARGPAGADPS